MVISCLHSSSHMASDMEAYILCLEEVMLATLDQEDDN